MSDDTPSARERLASCCCGQLRVRTRGEPVRVSMCHCLECQRRCGSVFAAQARFPDDRVEIEGESTEYSRTGDEGGVARFHFCPRCGSTVWYVFDGAPGMTVVTVGAFADPHFPPPSFSVYEDRRHAWVAVPEGAERWA
ncbi:MAG TPA: GFA family protein [Burkholderiaceae bacterium]